MAKPMPMISCNKCNLVQAYRGQANCIFCGIRLNNWSVASQLRVAEHKRRQENNDDEQDGS